jgi:2-(1,2-epoxy-1,2-dihydrophenyl)acetyl-CoA isomerase
MSVEDLRLEKDGATARIIFNLPAKANAIQPGWPIAILSFLRRIELDDSIRSVLISAEGRHFQAGGDLTLDLDMPLTDAVGVAHDAMLKWNRMMMAIHTLKKPVVCAVQGGTIGASLSIVAACDLVFAADDAFFISAQAKIGSSLDGLPSYFLPRKIGLSRAMEWALLGERHDAAAARDAGLVNWVVPRAELEASALALCAKLARAPTIALGLTKNLLNVSLDNDINKQAAAEMAAYGTVMASSDWKEGIVAFLGKRDPDYSGR